jgi:hypothetical protein
MKVYFHAFLILFLTNVAVAQTSADEFLGRAQIQFQDPNPDRKIEQIVEDPRAVFLRFQPGLDRGSKVVSGPEVGGPQTNPTLKVSIRKCVFIVCETVDLDAEARIENIPGRCSRNLNVKASLSRSSPLLSGNFQELNIQVCVQISGESANVTLGFFAVRTNSYPSGLGTKELLTMLKLQTQPLAQAFESVLNSL